MNPTTPVAVQPIQFNQTQGSLPGFVPNTPSIQPAPVSNGGTYLNLNDQKAFQTATNGLTGNAYNAASNNFFNVNTSPVVKSPATTVNAANIGGATPYALPNSTPSTVATASNSVMASAQAQNDGLQPLIQQQDANISGLQSNSTNLAKTLQDTIAQYGLKGQEQTQLENDAGVAGKYQLYKNLSTEYQTKQLAYNKQYNDIQKNSAGLTSAQVANQIDSLTKDRAYDMTDLAIRQSIASEDYNTTEQLIQHKIDIKYGDLKDLIGFQEDFLNRNEDKLSKAQDQKLQIQLEQNKRTYDQGVQAQKDIGDVAIEAGKNGAPSNVISAINKATDRNSAIQAAAGYFQNPLDIELKKAQIEASKASTAKAYNDIKNSNLSNSAPTILSPYMQTAYDGTQYADLSSLTPSEKSKYALIATQAGIKPILDAGTAGKVGAISVSKENLQNIQDSLTNQNLLNDKQLPGIQGLINSGKSVLGNSDVKSFNAWRTAVINNVQALAGGQGSGLRINQAEIDTALKNDLPTLTGVNADNLSTAQAKIAKLNSQLDTWTKQILGGGNTAASHIPPVGTVISQGGKKYHVIDSAGNIEEIK